MQIYFDLPSIRVKHIAWEDSFGLTPVSMRACCTILRNNSAPVWEEDFDFAIGREETTEEPGAVLGGCWRRLKL